MPPMSAPLTECILRSSDTAFMVRRKRSKADDDNKRVLDLDPQGLIVSQGSSFIVCEVSET